MPLISERRRRVRLTRGQRRQMQKQIAKVRASMPATTTNVRGTR